MIIEFDKLGYQTFLRNYTALASSIYRNPVYKICEIRFIFK